MSDVSASMLTDQLARVEAITAARRAIWAAYDEGLAGLEATGRLRRLRIPDRRLRPLATPGDTLDPELAHQPRHPLASDVDVVLVGELELDPRRPVGLQRPVVDRHDQPGELLIAQLPQRRPAPPRRRCQAPRRAG